MADGSEAVGPGQLRLSLFGKNGLLHPLRGDAGIPDERSVLMGWLELDEDAPKQGHFSVADFTTPRLNPCFLLKPSLRCWSASSWGGLRSRKRGSSED